MQSHWYDTADTYYWLKLLQTKEEEGLLSRRILKLWVPDPIR